MSTLNIAEVSEAFGHIGAIWCIVGETGHLDYDALHAGLFQLDDADRERAVDGAFDALVDIRDWAQEYIDLLTEAGRE